MVEYVRSCDVCQRNKNSLLESSGSVTSPTHSTAVWEDISMDFVEGLPKSKGVDTILVVVDRLSKYSHFLSLKHHFTAVSVADVFIKVVRLHEFPTTIVSDQDRVFISIFRRELFRLQGTELKRSIAYHPQTDGQSEMVNKGLLLCSGATKVVG